MGHSRHRTCAAFALISQFVSAADDTLCTLRSLRVWGGMSVLQLIPSFSPDVHMYSAHLDFAANPLWVQAVPSSWCRARREDATRTLLPGHTLEMRLGVIETGEKVRAPSQYIVSVERRTGRETALFGLSVIGAGPLSPPFSPDQFEYTADVALVPGGALAIHYTPLDTGQVLDVISVDSLLSDDEAISQLRPLLGLSAAVAAVRQPATARSLAAVDGPSKPPPLSAHPPHEYEARNEHLGVLLQAAAGVQTAWGHPVALPARVTLRVRPALAWKAKSGDEDSVAEGIYQVILRPPALTTPTTSTTSTTSSTSTSTTASSSTLQRNMAADITSSSVATTTSTTTCINVVECTDGPAVASAVLHAQGSSCRDIMTNNETCQVECLAGYKAVGKFTCTYGKLAGFSQCLDKTDSSRRTVERAVVSGGLKVSAEIGELTLDQFGGSLQGAIGESMGVTASDTVVTVTQEGRRLLGLLERRLEASSYNVDYQIVVPEDIDASEVLQAANDVGSADSTVAASIVTTLSDADITASGLAISRAPSQHVETVVVDAETGNVAAPSPPSDVDASQQTTTKTLTRTSEISTTTKIERRPCEKCPGSSSSTTTSTTLTTALVKAQEAYRGGESEEEEPLEEIGLETETFFTLPMSHKLPVMFFAALLCVTVGCAFPLCPSLSGERDGRARVERFG
eukprot:gnl/TRDRNA2_/TRDRNA2_85993_c0_seq1.p1 gnl/TRDRNA2_/TRDRNA2_85993_c0~~gnl/TRDRNA2_/TRDRNA2_85993_c0_seq1.p1  ORF type:complete len:685 (-),score=101.70 gnl/TRDRNA2_/TRDRNA2_85993_c0_seq1:108-2162(-)